MAAPRFDGAKTGRRLLNADGTTAVVRLNVRTLRIGDLYHWLLTSSRMTFTGVLVGGYLGINLAFACAYLAAQGGIENARPGSLEDAFFFSVQTMATIGYGKMVPISTVANALVTAEACIGIFGIAMAAALMFAPLHPADRRGPFQQQDGGVAGRWGADLDVPPGQLAHRSDP